MFDFINIFRSLMIWLSRPGPEMRNRVRVIIEFERPEDLAHMKNTLRMDLKEEYKGYFDSMDQVVPQTCYGIPFELTVRARGG